MQSLLITRNVESELKKTIVEELSDFGIKYDPAIKFVKIIDSSISEFNNDYTIVAYNNASIPHTTIICEFPDNNSTVNLYLFDLCKYKNNVELNALKCFLVECNEVLLYSLNIVTKKLLIVTHVYINFVFPTRYKNVVNVGLWNNIKFNCIPNSILIDFCKTKIILALVLGNKFLPIIYKGNSYLAYIDDLFNWESTFAIELHYCCINVHQNTLSISFNCYYSVFVKYSFIEQQNICFLLPYLNQVQYIECLDKFIVGYGYNSLIDLKNYWSSACNYYRIDEASNAYLIIIKNNKKIIVPKGYTLKNPIKKIDIEAEYVEYYDKKITKIFKRIVNQLNLTSKDISIKFELDSKKNIAVNNNDMSIIETIQDLDLDLIDDQLIHEIDKIFDAINDKMETDINNKTNITDARQNVNSDANRSKTKKGKVKNQKNLPSELNHLSKAKVKSTKKVAKLKLDAN